jgi:hypothetical protein
MVVLRLAARLACLVGTSLGIRNCSLRGWTMSKDARRNRDRGKKDRLRKNANTELASAPPDQSNFIALRPGANMPPISFEGVVTTSTNFIVGSGQDIEISGKAIHIPEPGPSRVEIRSITFGRDDHDCPGCQRIRAIKLQWDEAARQAFRVTAVNGWEGPLADIGAQKDTVTIVNESDYPIYQVDLLGAWLEIPGAIVVRSIYRAPENRLEGEALQVEVLQPGERHTFRGEWKWRADFILSGNIILERRTAFAWTDNQERDWQRGGNELPKSHPRSWRRWGFNQYVDEPNIRSETEDRNEPSH